MNADWTWFSPERTSLREAAEWCGMKLDRVEPHSNGKYHVSIAGKHYMTAFPNEIWDSLKAVHGCPIEANADYVLTPAVNRAFELDRSRQEFERERIKRVADKYIDRR